jgi:hypothetical protein
MKAKNKQFEDSIYQVYLCLLLLTIVTIFFVMYYSGNHKSQHHEIQSDTTVKSSNRMQFSTFRFIGGNGYERANQRILWHFQNVCYSAIKQSLIYYQDPSELVPAPILFENGTVTDFGRIYYVGNRNYKSKYNLDVLKSKTPIPHDAFYVNERVAVWSTPMFDFNFGHFFADGVFPVFHALKQLNLGSIDDAYVIWKGSSGTFNRKWAVDYGLLSSDPRENYNEVIQRELTCFKNLVIGVNHFQFSRYESAGIPNLGWAASYLDFRNLVRKKIAGLTPSDCAKHQMILVVKKNGRRRILNHEQMVAHLRKTFPSVPVQETDYNMKPSEQLQLMSQASVIISPPGALSMISMFTADNTVGIFPDFWHPTRRKSIGMEQHFYQIFPWFTNFQYSVTPNDVVTTKRFKNLESKWRDADTIIDLNRMSKLVYSSLFRVKQMRGEGFDFDDTIFKDQLNNG